MFLNIAYSYDLVIGLYFNLIIRGNRDTHWGSFGSREITLVAILPFVSLVAGHYLE